MDILTCVLSVLVAFLVWKVYGIVVTWLGWVHTVKDIPIHPDNHWLFGIYLKVHNIEDCRRIFIEFIEKEKPKWFVAWVLFLVPAIYPASPDVLRQVLSATSVPKRHGWAGPYRMMSKWIGDGLLVSNGKKWERNRRLLTPAFHFDILKPYVKVYNQVVETFMERVKDSSKGGNSINIYPMMSRATLDTMLRCTMSYNDDTVQNLGEQHHYVADTHRLTYLLVKRIVNPIMFFDCIYNLTADGKEFKKLCQDVHAFSAQIISNRRKDIDADPNQLEKRHRDFLDILISARDEHDIGMTDREIRDEVDTVLFAGHDTTASLISWLIYSLGKYPDMQQQVRDEIEGILNGRTSPEVDDLVKLKYTTCFIKEVMRYYTPVPAFVRNLDRPMTIDGITFAAGQFVDVHGYLLHHSPTVWDNHWEFRPERFLPENSVGRDPFAFIPFSAGQRNCIGQHLAMDEIKTFVFRIVTRFTLRVDPCKVAVPWAELVTRAKDGIYVYFDERKLESIVSI